MKTNQNCHYVIFFSLDTNERNYETCNLFRWGESASRREEIVTTCKSVLENKASLFPLAAFEELYKNGWNVGICLLIK